MCNNWPPLAPHSQNPYVNVSFHVGLPSGGSTEAHCHSIGFRFEGTAQQADLIELRWCSIELRCCSIQFRCPLGHAQEDASEAARAEIIKIGCSGRPRTPRGVWVSGSWEFRCSGCPRTRRGVWVSGSWEFRCSGRPRQLRFPMFRWSWSRSRSGKPVRPRASTPAGKQNCCRRRSGKPVRPRTAAASGIV